jgi:hypothetical protein
MRLVMGGSAKQDTEVLRSTRRLIRIVNDRSGLVYADQCGSISLISVEIIARRVGAGIRIEPLALGTHEIGFPGYFGPPVIVVNKYDHYGMRSIAIRHGLAHLVAGELEVGEVSDLRFMSSILDYMMLEERRADLFALADMVADWMVEGLHASGAPAEKVELELRRHVKALAPEWPAARVRDRSRLRLALYEGGR